MAPERAPNSAPLGLSENSRKFTLGFPVSFPESSMTAPSARYLWGPSRASLGCSAWALLCLSQGSARALLWHQHPKAALSNSMPGSTKTTPGGKKWLSISRKKAASDPGALEEFRPLKKKAPKKEHALVPLEEHALETPKKSQGGDASAEPPSSTKDCWGQRLESDHQPFPPWFPGSPVPLHRLSGFPKRPQNPEFRCNSMAELFSPMRRLFSSFSPLQ